MSTEYSEDYYVKKLLGKVKLKEIMTKDVYTVQVDDKFSLVEEKMRVHGIRHIPVVNMENELLGIVTQRDLYRIQSPRENSEGILFYDKATLDEFKVDHVMTHEPSVLGPDHTLEELIYKMADFKYGCIPIVDNENKLLGIVTQIDIVKQAALICRRGN